MMSLFLKVLPFLRKWLASWLALPRGGDPSKEITAIQQLKAFYEKYDGEWNPEFNIFGIRNRENPKADKFDDWIGCHYIDDNGRDQIIMFQATTDPSVYWTKHSSTGVFHMARGFHKDIWVFDKHWGKYEALCQRKGRSGKVKGWRDTNRNLKRDPTDKEATTKESINLHRASVHRLIEKIGRYSAGCQVVRSIKDFLILMGLARESGLKKFSYMLFTADQVPAKFRHNLLKG